MLICTRWLLFAFLWCVAVHSAFPNALENPPNTVDGLKIVEGAQALMAGATADRVIRRVDGSGVELQPGAVTGSLTLAPVISPIPFNELITSWNGYAPPGTGFRVWMRAAGITPTPWFEAGTWGNVGDEPTTRVHRFETGIYELDTLWLSGPAAQVHVRVDFFRPDAAIESPHLRMVVLACTNTLGDAKLFRRYGDKRPQISREVGRLRTTESLSIPFAHQVIPNKKWIGRICAPCSVNMALKHFGVGTDTQAVATQLYDPVSDAFGIWHRSIQGAAQHGIRGYIRRMRNWDDVRESLRRGEVICASIRFKHGELTAPPREYRRHGTEGHLIVIAGLAPGGVVIANNSATKDYGYRELWRMDDLAKAWFDKGGVAYVFTGR